jgi:hypothetical protein
VSTIEEVLERKNSGSGLETREYGLGDPSLWPCGTFYPQNLAQTSLRSDGRSVVTDRSRTQATGFSLDWMHCVVTSLCLLTRGRKSHIEMLQELKATE